MDLVKLNYRSIGGMPSVLIDYLQAGMVVLFYRPWEVCNLFRVSMWDSGRQLWDCHASKGARLP
ncbi:unnamed protein product [Prunus armeniaca]